MNVRLKQRSADIGVLMHVLIAYGCSICVEEPLKSVVSSNASQIFLIRLAVYGPLHGNNISILCSMQGNDVP